MTLSGQGSTLQTSSGQQIIVLSSTSGQAIRQGVTVVTTAMAGKS